MSLLPAGPTAGRLDELTEFRICDRSWATRPAHGFGWAAAGARVAAHAGRGNWGKHSPYADCRRSSEASASGSRSSTSSSSSIGSSAAQCDSSAALLIDGPPKAAVLPPRHPFVECCTLAFTSIHPLHVRIAPLHVRTLTQHASPPAAPLSWLHLRPTANPVGPCPYPFSAYLEDPCDCLGTCA